MIEFTDVVKTYDQGNNALNGVTMQIEDGEFCFLVGPSGSGKSTIIKMITGELKPTSGTVHVNGYSLERIRKREIPYLRRTVGVVFQDFRLINKMTVYENVAFAMRVIGAREKEIRERVPYVLELVGLSDKALTNARALMRSISMSLSAWCWFWLTSFMHPGRSDLWIYFTVMYSSPSMSIDSKYMSPQNMLLQSCICL